jgi:curli biogenesis system outer membrane secretion channel CsgG
MRLVALAGGLFLVATATLAQSSRPKIAIKTFENPAEYSRSTIGDGLTEILTTELQNTGKFNVLERTHVDELTKEMDFGTSGYAKGNSFAQKGNLLGAQYILTGKVTNFSYVENAGTRQKVNLFGPNTLETVYQQRADVRVDFRLIDVSTGETVISEAGLGRTTNTSRVSEMATWTRCITSGTITAEESSSQIGRATTEAVKDIVRKLNELSATVRERGAASARDASLNSLANAQGQLVADEGGGLWVVGGIGIANGLRKGDHLTLMRENVVKDSTGKVVYRKSAPIGAMEVTDVSEADHAEARYLANSESASVKPQAHDIITVDMKYAGALRGGAHDSTTGIGVVSAVPAGELDEILKRADGYVSDRFWSQALDEYGKAAALNSQDARVLQGQATTHYMMEDFIEGDDSANKLLQTGGQFSLNIAHYHAMGLCKGQMVIQKGKLIFRSGSQDGFELSATDLEAVEVRNLPKSFMVNEAVPDWPVLEIVVRDAKGHSKKYEMLPYEYSKQQNPRGKNFASAFPMDDSDLHEVQKFERSVVTLIQQYIR